ncbi:MAG: TonB-dependent receptor [Alphaproteobacteria bacterium]|nr:TonB-dependent receptor [Alphaproteobacteria bacterium]
MKRGQARRILLCGAAAACLLAGHAAARSDLVNIPAGSLKAALDAFIRQTGAQLIYNVDDVAELATPGLRGVPADRALSQLLAGTGMSASRDRSGAVIISRATGAAAAGEILPPETVVVTGSRILGAQERSTPVTSLPTEQLLATTPGGIPEALDKMPIFMGGSTPNNATTGANGRGNNAPGYFLNLRDLGAIRTLILEDGHRVPGTFYDTTVDIDMLPQMLVSRVEVVAGGASAVYGSDAVAGVVNFVLDRAFTGFKAVASGGISGQADARALRLGVAGGEDILPGGHLIWSVEYHNRAALPDAAARPLGNLGTSIVGSGTAANPYTLVRGIRQSNTAPGGLVVSGPGKGLQFLSDGSLAPFDQGMPTATANFAIGGDGGIEHNEYLLPAFSTGQVFAHYNQVVTPSITAYVQARYSLARSYEAGQIFTNVNGSGISTNGASAQYPITIYSGNAFLTPAAQAFLFPAGGPTSFQMNRMDNDLMSRLALDQHTGALAVSAGLQGQGPASLNWDVNFTHGETRTQLITRNNVDTARFYAALDAVRDPATSKIVCNVDLTAPGAFPGCVPLNLFGQSAAVVNGSNASQAALDYVGVTTSWTAHNDMDDFSANLTGDVLDLPAGPVKFAAGSEYRFARLQVDTSTPGNTFNPQYLRLAPPGTFAPTAASPDGSFPPADLAHFKEVLSGAAGSETVAEANLELDVPLVKDLPLARLISADGAMRYTDYHVGGMDPAGSGFVKTGFASSTWKLGLAWQVTDDLSLRATRSRDIRAPTLWDLFQGPNTTTSGVSDALTGVSGSANTQAIGNPNLSPEVAHNTTAGLIYEPGWLAGARVKLDYFHIDIIDEIAGVSGASNIVQSLCLASPGGSSPYCALIQRPVSYNDTSALNFPTLYYSQPQNFQHQWTEGYDFEASYQADVSDWAGQGAMLGLRLLWTHTSFLKTRGLPGWVVTNVAGSANAPGDALPADKVALIASFVRGSLSVDLLERYYGPLHPSPNSNLIFARSVANLPEWFQTDINIAVALGGSQSSGSIFLNVSNLLDAQPGVFQVPSYTGSPGMNYPVVPYEDIIGRYFTLGVRYRM